MSVISERRGKYGSVASIRWTFRLLFFALFFASLREYLLGSTKIDENLFEQATGPRVRGPHRCRQYSLSFSDHFPERSFLPPQSVPNQLSSTKTWRHPAPTYGHRPISCCSTITETVSAGAILASIYWINVQRLLSERSIVMREEESWIDLCAWVSWCAHTPPVLLLEPHTTAFRLRLYLGGSYVAASFRSVGGSAH